MELVGIILFGVIMPIALIICVYKASNRLAFWLINYRFSPNGIDIVAFGKRVVLFRIKRASIREVQIIRGFDIKLYSPFVTNIKTRYFGTTLLVRTNGLFSYSLSPDDPEAAVKALEISE